MAPQMRKQAQALWEAYFNKRDVSNTRDLRQAQSVYTQLVEHERTSGDTQQLVNALGSAAEAALLLGMDDTARRLFSELQGLEACTGDRPLAGQPSCAAFAGCKLAVLRRAAGDRVGAIAAFAVAMKKGATWTNQWQLPPEHLPGLLARPVWPAAEVPLTLRLLRALADIGKDLRALEAETKRGKRVKWQSTPDFFLLDPKSGAWQEIMLKGGSWEKAACKKAPRVCSLLRGLPEVDGPGNFGGRDLGTPGRVAFLRMGPGAVLRPHTANWNGRLNVHLPLRVPSACPDAGCGGLRVADEPLLEWRLHQPVVFDDSFIHEASLPADADGERIVLHVSVWHPEVVAHTPADVPISALDDDLVEEEGSEQDEL